MENNQIKKNIAENLIQYRTQAGLTQQQLAQKINYSDKSVSKWERAEGVPDIFVLCELAEFYGINPGDFVLPKGESPNIKNSELLKKKRLLINLLSVGLVWLVAVTVFFLLNMVLGFLNANVECNWIVFIYAIPVSGIVQTVFSELWWNKLSTLIASSVIIWGTVLSVFLTFTVFSLQATGVNTIFLISAVLEVLNILWFFLRGTKQK